MEYIVFFNRLVDWYCEHKKLIIAYDFDSTVFPLKEEEKEYCEKIVNLICRWKNHAHLICYTARNYNEFYSARKYLLKNNIPFNYINRDHLGKIPKNGSKIYYNAFIDDKCGTDTVVKALTELIECIEKGIL